MFLGVYGQKVGYDGESVCGWAVYVQSGNKKGLQDQ